MMMKALFVGAPNTSWGMTWWRPRVSLETFSSSSRPENCKHLLSTRVFSSSPLSQGELCRNWHPCSQTGRETATWQVLNKNQTVQRPWSASAVTILRLRKILTLWSFRWFDFVTASPTLVYVLDLNIAGFIVFDLNCEISFFFFTSYFYFHVCLVMTFSTFFVVLIVRTATLIDIK